MSASATCQGCGEVFAARRSDAKWCSDRCRKAESRKAEHVPALVMDDAPSSLVSAVESELEKAGVSLTFAGQLAVSLAKRLANPEETGASSLSKELRTVMAAALAGVTPPAASEDDDEVAKARKSRERKASYAAGQA